MTRTWDLDDEALDTFPLDAGAGAGRVRVVDEETSTFLDGEDLLALLAETDGLEMDFVAPRPVGAAEGHRVPTAGREAMEGHNPAQNRQLPVEGDWTERTATGVGQREVWPSQAPDEEAMLHDDVVDSLDVPVVASRRRRLVADGGRGRMPLDDLAQAHAQRAPAGKELPFSREVVLETRSEAWDVAPDQADALLQAEAVEPPAASKGAGAPIVEEPSTVATVDLGAWPPVVGSAGMAFEAPQAVDDDLYDEDMDEPVTVLNTGDEWRLPARPEAHDFAFDDEGEHDDGAIEEESEVFAMPDDEPVYAAEDTSSVEAIHAPPERRKGWADGLRPTVRGGDGQPIAPVAETEESVPVWDARSEPDTGVGGGRKHIGSWQPGQKAAPAPKARKGAKAGDDAPISPTTAAAYGLGFASMLGGVAVVAWFFLT